jgi:hypothetical protein
MQLYVDKNTDLMRSTFIAVGLAHLLYKIPSAGSGQQVTIRDMGSCYGIESDLSYERLTQQVSDAGRLPAILPAIFKPLTSKEQKLLEAGTPAQELRLKYVPRDYVDPIDYGKQRAVAQAASKRKKKDDVRAEEDAQEAHPDYPVWAHLCSYFGKGSAMRVGYPTLIHNWHAHEDQNAVGLWQLICDCYESFPNATNATREIWRTEFLSTIDYQDYALATDISALAIVSPSTSKGVSAAAGYNTLSESTPDEFWLEMYFAFAGYMKIALPFNLGSDVTTYYPVPYDIDLITLETTISRYRKSVSGRSLYRFSNAMPRARLDALMSITFYQEMIQQQIMIADSDDWPEFSAEAIGGLVGYYYKNIATQIPFDETTFGLPAWLPHDTRDTDVLHAAHENLEQHRKLIDSLRGRPPKYQITADELTLINHYRRYLTHGQSWDWILFAIAHGQYRFRVLPDIPGLSALSTTLLKESLPMNDRIDFRPVLENPGFQNIAAALNHCTTYARYKKDVQRDKTFGFKVRHGVGDDLLRNAHDPAQFIADLGAFVHDYQQESSSVQARTKQTRSAIQPDDVHAVAALVAEYGSRTVAHLLVAVGYAARFDLTKSS